MLFKKLFAVEDLKDRNKIYKLITFFGVKIKTRIYPPKRVKFPDFAISCVKTFKNADDIKIIHSKAAVFAGFDYFATLSENTLQYLEEIRKNVDYLICVFDNPVIPDELEKIKSVTDAVIFERHAEYDFGSYKRGYIFLKENGITEKVNNIYFINDSVFYNGFSMQEIFEQNKGKDFYGLTIHDYGYIRDNTARLGYHWGICPHVQSYFFSLSKSIFKTDWFDDFMLSVKRLKHKEDVIMDYEIGLSKLISSKQYKLSSYYPEIHKNIEPCHYYLNENSDYSGQFLLVKKSLKY